MRSCDSSAASVKRGTTPTLQIYLDGVDMAEVASVTFLFKALAEERGPALVEKTVKSPKANPVEVEFTGEETYLLPPAELWMDTRIVLNSGKIPPTELVKVRVMETLFPQDKEG
nr:MAG TPA: hypothetical protein [Caudoviricetes sp.]